MFPSANNDKILLLLFIAAEFILFVLCLHAPTWFALPFIRWIVGLLFFVKCVFVWMFLTERWIVNCFCRRLPLRTTSYSPIVSLAHMGVTMPAPASIPSSSGSHSPLDVDSDSD